MPAGERLSVELQASRWLVPALAAAHAAAAISLALSLRPGWLLAGCLALVFASAAIVLRRTGKYDAGSRLELEADGACRWQRRDTTLSGRLRTDTTALPGLIVLRFDESGCARPRSVVLFPGAVSAEDWRALQVFLRWAVRFGDAASVSSGGPS